MRLWRTISSPSVASTTVLRILVLVIVVTSFGAGSSSGQEPEEWQPSAPEGMPSDSDWVMLDSGEWLKGEILVMYQESLEFDSDKLGVLNLDWEDISQIRSSAVIQVGFEDRPVAVGRLFLDGDLVRVMGDTESEYERAAVLSFTVGEPTEASYWDSKVSVGLNVREGNTEQSDFNARVLVRRRTTKNRAVLDFLGNYAENNSVELADNSRLAINWDRFLSNRLYISPIVFEHFRDPFQNIAHRYTLGVGVGYTVVDTSHIDWDVTAGPAYQRVESDQFPAGTDGTSESFALMLGTTYVHELTDDIDYDFAFRMFLLDEDAGEYTHHLVTGFSFDLTRILDFDAHVIWDRTNKPQPRDDALPERDDFQFILGLGLDF